VNHLPILPILLPSAAGILMLVPPLATRLRAQRWFTWLVLVALMAIAGVMVLQAQRHTLTYQLGAWPPPVGILLHVDRFTALLLALTAILAFSAGVYSADNEDREGPYFYPLFLFQIMGVNGAFLTGDLFNLFVFFEVLLISSYALLVHGGGKKRSKAGFQYVTLNLIGSAFFLIALGTLYGTVGSINMADMAAKIARLSPEHQALARAGGLLLLLVFGLKSALLPLHFWLPKTYAAASAAIAALFAIMTKVGLYSIYRVFGGIFGDTAGALAHIATPWIWPLAIATIAVGSVGVYIASSLRLLTANLVIVSVGTLLLALVIGDGQSLYVGLYYLIHSTLFTGVLFLIADQIGAQRGAARDRFYAGSPMNRTTLLGTIYLIAAVAAVGLPPLSGFIGKAMLLQATQRFAEQVWVWPALLISSMISLIALLRAGTFFFWQTGPYTAPEGRRVRAPQFVAISVLLVTIGLLTVFAEATVSYSQDAARDIQDHLNANHHQQESTS